MRYYLLMVLIAISSYAIANMAGVVDLETLKDTTKRYKKIDVLKVDE